MVEVLKSEEIYEGRVFTVSVDTVREGEQEFVREVVRHAGSGVVVAVFDDKTIALVRQYRHPAGKYLLEIPAGSRDAGESPEECARRELEEELGVRAERLEKLSEFYVSPGFLSEKMWVYLATGLTETKQNLDFDEQLEIVRLPIARVLEMIESGEIEDAKTIIGIQLAATRLGVNNRSDQAS
jgi:ADP-ribose pyrophosphatase